MLLPTPAMAEHITSAWKFGASPISPVAPAIRASPAYNTGRAP